MIYNKNQQNPYNKLTKLINQTKWLETNLGKVPSVDKAKIESYQDKDYYNKKHKIMVLEDK